MIRFVFQLTQTDSLMLILMATQTDDIKVIIMVQEAMYILNSYERKEQTERDSHWLELGSGGCNLGFVLLINSLMDSWMELTFSVQHWLTSISNLPSLSFQKDVCLVMCCCTFFGCLQWTEIWILHFVFGLLESNIIMQLTAASPLVHLCPAMFNTHPLMLMNRIIEKVMLIGKDKAQQKLVFCWLLT